MKTRRIADFDELLDTRYGGGSPRPKRFAATIEDLLGSHYGAPATTPAAPKLPAAQALSVDDGEVLTQRRVARSLSRPFSTEPAPPTPIAQPAPDAAPPLPEDERARQEKLLDLCAAQPVQSTQPVHPVQPAQPASANAAPQPGPTPPVPAPVSGQAPAPPAPATGAPAPPADAPPKPQSEDEFLADMKSILSGQKAYDPQSKTLTDRHGIAKPPEAHDDPLAAPRNQPPPRVPPTGDGHDIFRAIAQSMEYAGAYDLGAVELDNRFAQFEESASSRRPKTVDPAATAPAVAPPAMAPPVIAPPVVPPPTIGREEFKADLQDMLARPTLPEPPQPPAPEQFFPDVGGAVPAPPSAAPLWATESSRLPGYAEPLYDTGEHVLAGGDLYPDQLRVGPPPGVTFSYGELIAMADLFGNVDEMMGASAAELTRLKAKIQAGAAHYRAKAGQRPPNPGNVDWDEITGGRYMRLAEDNYEHFAPNLLFKDAAFAESPLLKGNHRAAWESCHRRAIAEAQAMALDPANSNRSYIPERPLVINAFGDHFLTDAFASGHVFNKEAIENGFKANFFSGGKINADAKAFLGRLAAKVFTGDFKAKFSKLETYEPYDSWWNVVGWNPNIDSASRFASLLEQIADREPGAVSNLAVKGMHDRLNDEGIAVVNAAGSGEWKLFGDGNLHLSPRTLEIMRAAVKQSVENILDPAILATNAPIDALVEKVWAFVPQLTPASAKKVRDLAPLYITPSSSVLLESTAALLTEEVDQLIKVLTDPKRKALKKA